MTSPRTVRLVRAPTLHAYQQYLTAASLDEPVGAIRRTAILVPTRAAAGQLRRTIERAALEAGRTALVLPDLLTRGDWYERLLAAAAPAPWLSSIEREAMLQAAAYAAITDGIVPPFRLRPALVGEMLALYDDLRRHQQEVDDFERLLAGELEPRASIDRGAERMLRQTAFLAATFRAYERQLSDSGAFDEHALRNALIGGGSPSPHRRVIVSTGDRAAEPGGLWPADFDLLSRAPGLEWIDVLSTEEQLAAGFHERVLSLFPGIEDVRLEHRVSPLDARTLLVPANAEALHFTSRDREEEIAAVVRRIRTVRRSHGNDSPLDRIAMVFARPLPYLYLARGILHDGSVAYQCDDTLPLAAEPPAAALDVIISVAATSASRVTLVELLRSPHLAWGAPGGVSLDAVEALGRALAEAGYSGGPDHLFRLEERWVAEAGLDRGSNSSGAETPERLAQRRNPAEEPLTNSHVGAATSARPPEGVRVAKGRAEGPAPTGQLFTGSEAGFPHDDRAASLRRRAMPALHAAAEAVRALLPLFEEAPASVHLDTLHRFLSVCGRVPGADDASRDRSVRARTAILGIIASMRSAVSRHGDLRGTADDVGAALRRTIETQTFAPRTGRVGVHLVDAAAARYGAFDDVHLMGLVDGEWPERPRRNLFYSPFLLGRLGWQADSRLTAARAGFLDLTRLAARHTSASTFQLEDDVLTDPSALLEDLAVSGLQPAPYEDGPWRVFLSDALAAADPMPLIDPARTGAWLPLRLARTPAADPMFHGRALPASPRTFSVSAIDRYTQCPFQYFATRVLRLDEEVEDQAALTPRERGIFVHEVFQRFYEAWDAEVGGRITPRGLARARRMLEEILAPLLDTLPPADAALERTRLLGSPVAPGVADLVFRMEAERSDAVIERRMEDRFDAVFELQGEAGPRLVPLRGIVDRIDLLEGGRLRIVDYKSSAPLTHLQLALYAMTAEQRLRGYRHREWRTGEAAYIVFNAGRGVKPIGRRPEDREREVALAADRTIAAVDGIQGGAFAPRPLQVHLCSTCAVAAVCRKDHVTEDREPDAAPAV